MTPLPRVRAEPVALRVIHRLNRRTWGHLGTTVYSIVGLASPTQAQRERLVHHPHTEALTERFSRAPEGDWTVVIGRSNGSVASED